MIVEEIRLTDNILLSNLNVSALNKNIISLYKQLLVSSEKDRLAGLEIEDFLKQINAAGMDSNGNLVPTTAGLLMFGAVGDIRNNYPNYFLDYQQLCPENPETWNYRVTSDVGLQFGNIFEFYIKVSKLLNEHPLIRETTAKQTVKEALANALIHADYTERRGILVKISDNYLEISNPGTLLVSKEQFFKGGISDPRNPLIFQMFTKIGMSDRAGKGIRKIMETWQEQEWIQPSCRIQTSPARIELHLHMSE